MTRVLLALALIACRPDPGPRLAQLEAESAELRAKLAAHERRLDEAERALVEHEKRIRQAMALALVGGPVPRYRIGVKCKDGPFLPGSIGDEAHGGLWFTGWCDDQALAAAPSTVLVVNR